MELVEGERGSISEGGEGPRLVFSDLQVATTSQGLKVTTETFLVLVKYKHSAIVPC